MNRASASTCSRSTFLTNRCAVKERFERAPRPQRSYSERASCLHAPVAFGEHVHQGSILSGKRRRSLATVGVAKPDSIKSAEDWGIFEEERYVVENGVKIDLHDWITMDWDEPWWIQSDEDYVEPITPEPEEKPIVTDEIDEIAKQYVEYRKILEKDEFEADQAVVGVFKYYNNKNDIRLKNRAYRIDREWSEEEILELIGTPHWEPLTIQSPKHRNCYQDLVPAPPETHDWLEEKGMILEEEPTPEGEALLQSDFDGFDSSKITNMDINAFDIGEMEEEATVE